MTRLRTIEVIAGDTLRSTLQSNSLTPSPIVSCLYSGSETLVSSVTGVSSGNGGYYANHSIPNTSCWYVNKWFAYVAPDTYSKAQYVKAVKPEVG